ncbi:MAG TPA: hypothetical protein VM243_03165 [Phycisphaerae bacterium]|nr:hypothetical protein [Phycisphaerae bacterium]
MNISKCPVASNVVQVMNPVRRIGDAEPGRQRRRPGSRPRAVACHSRGVGAFLLGCILVLPALAPRAVAADGTATGDELTDRFVRNVADSDLYDEAVKTFITQRWAERKETEDAAGFLLEALALLSQEFRSGLAAFDEDRFADATGAMKPLTQSLDPYLAANAAVYEIKALVAADDLEQAERKIAALLALPLRVEQYTHASAEVHYLKGYCELGNLKYVEATRSLLDMLERFQDAPQRLQVTARQMLAEVRTRIPDGLGDVTDLMTYATRRMANDDTGQRVQERQGMAVEILDRLIEEAQQQEQSGAGGGGQSRPGSGSDRTQQPMRDSHLPQGPGSQQQRIDQRVANPGEAWGAMQPAERERIVQVLKENFPDRYRRLVEQYYEQLSQEP